MKKNCFIVFCLVLTVTTRIYAQLAVVAEPGPMYSLAIKTQIGHAFATAGSIAEQVENSLEQIQQFNTMIETQARALKKLADGDWQSFIEFTYLQSQAFAQQRKTLTNVRENLDKLKIEQNSMPDFSAMDESLAYFQGFFNRTGNLLTAADNLQKNIETSSKMMEALNGQKGQEDSLITQLQIQNQELGLLRGIVSDFATLTYTAQVNLEVERSVVEAAEKKRIDNAEKYLSAKRNLSDYIGDAAEQERNKEIRDSQLF